MEKDKEGATRLYSLSDLQDEGANPTPAYPTGRYGAILEVAGDRWPRLSPSASQRVGLPRHTVPNTASAAS